MELLESIANYAELFVTSALGAGFGTYLASYLKKKGENRAIHEDIDKLVDQVSAVTHTAKQIEAKISNEMWRRERKSDLQLKTIETVSTLTTDFIHRVMIDASYRPTVDWFSALSVVDGAIRALFHDDIYRSFKALETLIGTDNAGSPFGVHQFIERRDVAVKAMYSQVFDHIA